MTTTIAVIMTVHNRKNTTLECLKHLFSCQIPDNTSLTVYLMDDGSTDGTREAVIQNFPQVIVLSGSGNLYWNRGMRSCWIAALKNKHDFYLWLNDDTLLYENGICELYEVYGEIATRSIVAGQLCSIANASQPTYGGKCNGKVIPPSGRIEKCDVACGNVLFIPKIVTEEFGILNSFYTHKWGDFDYTIRAVKKGINIYTTRCYIGTCEKNNVARQKWCDNQYSLSERLTSFMAPTGATPIEYVYYSFRTKPLKRALEDSIFANWNNLKKCLFP